MRRKYSGEWDAAQVFWCNQDVGGGTSAKGSRRQDVVEYDRDVIQYGMTEYTSKIVKKKIHVYILHSMEGMKNLAIHPFYHNSFLFGNHYKHLSL